MFPRQTYGILGLDVFFFFTFMYSLNHIQIIGHLTENPEVRQLGNGTSVCDINIKSVGKVVKENGEEAILSSYHTVTVWRKLAEIVGDYCRAGSQIYVSGRIKTESWEGDNGQKRYKTKVIADEIILLDSKKEVAMLPESSAIAGGLNQAEVLGNLTREPEIRQTTSGQTVANLGIATNRRWQDRTTNEQKEETEFHTVVAWGALAQEIADKMKTGEKIYVRGRLQTRSWETPDGEKRYATEITADHVLQLGAKNLEFADGAAPVAKFKNTDQDDQPAPAVDIPEIKYESDIKPEDLPF